MWRCLASVRVCDRYSGTQSIWIGMASLLPTRRDMLAEVLFRPAHHCSSTASTAQWTQSVTTPTILAGTIIYRDNDRLVISSPLYCLHSIQSGKHSSIHQKYQTPWTDYYTTETFITQIDNLENAKKLLHSCIISTLVGENCWLEPSNGWMLSSIQIDAAFKSWISYLGSGSFTMILHRNSNLDCHHELK